MTNNQDLQRAWYIWMHTDAPLENYCFNKTNAPAYIFEENLNSLVSYVYWIGHNAIGKPDSDYKNIADKGLNKADILRAKLEGYNFPDDEKQKYREYLFITCNLLEELKRLTDVEDRA